jgi:hypothetical protein
MKNEPDAVIDDNCIIKGDKRYEIKKSSIWIFLLAKYSLILIGLAFTFSKFDFTPSVEKFLQYAIALILIFLTLVLPKNLIKIMIAVLIALLILFIVLGELYFISFIFKYCIVFFIFFMALLDSKKTHYYLLNNNKKIIANIIVGG